MFPVGIPAVVKKQSNAHKFLVGGQVCCAPSGEPREAGAQGGEGCAPMGDSDPATPTLPPVPGPQAGYWRCRDAARIPEATRSAWEVGDGTRWHVAERVRCSEYLMPRLVLKGPTPEDRRRDQLQLRHRLRLQPRPVRPTGTRTSSARTC